MSQHTHGVQGTTCEVSSLLLLCRSLGQSSGHETWQQTPCWSHLLSFYSPSLPTYCFCEMSVIDACIWTSSLQPVVLYWENVESSVWRQVAEVLGCRRLWLGLYQGDLCSWDYRASLYPQHPWQKKAFLPSVTSCWYLVKAARNVTYHCYMFFLIYTCFTKWFKIVLRDCINIFL